jgi:uncharacterized membrane protein affecting hemolysin expression
VQHEPRATGDRSAVQTKWDHRNPNQTSTANQTSDIAKPSIRINAGHLSKIFVNDVMIEDIDCNRQHWAHHELVFAASSYKVCDQTINSLSDKALILGMPGWNLSRAPAAATP